MVNPPAPDPKASAALWTAIISLISLGVLGVLLALMVPTADEVPWQRYTYLLGIVQSIAFGGAGWLWGREVHRADARQANRRADASDDTARRAIEHAATKTGQLKTLTQAITKLADKSEDELGGGQRTAHQRELRYLADLAESIDNAGTPEA